MTYLTTRQEIERCIVVLLELLDSFPEGEATEQHLDMVFEVIGDMGFYVSRYISCIPVH